MKENRIRVGSNSPVYGVAGAIAGTYRDHGQAQVQAIGAGAVNQALKAIIHAKRFLAEDGKAIIFTPAFVDLELNGRNLTAIRLFVQPEPGKPDTVEELIEQLEEHHAETPRLSGGDKVSKRDDMRRELNPASAEREDNVS